jgi:predicted peptidase
LALILYLHGAGGSADGPKVRRLRARGHVVLAPSLDESLEGADLSTCIEAVIAACEGKQPEVIVASSRGAAVAVALPMEVPLILLSPAVESFDRVRRVSASRAVRVIHSATDHVVPWEEARTFVAASGLGPDCLLTVGDGHAASDDETLDALLNAVDWAARQGRPAE